MNSASVIYLPCSHSKVDCSPFDRRERRRQRNRWLNLSERVLKACHRLKHWIDLWMCSRAWVSLKDRKRSFDSVWQGKVPEWGNERSDCQQGSIAGRSLRLSSRKRSCTSLLGLLRRHSNDPTVDGPKVQRPHWQLPVPRCSEMDDKPKENFNLTVNRLTERWLPQILCASINAPPEIAEAPKETNSIVCCRLDYIRQSFRLSSKRGSRDCHLSEFRQVFSHPS